MKKKQQVIKMIQQDGVIKIHRNGECEQSYNFNIVVNKVKSGDMTAIELANFVGELVNDSLNCKTATSVIEDLNGCNQYRGTYFEDLNYFTD